MHRRALLLTPLALAACAAPGAGPAPRFAEIGFRTQPQLRFRVASAELANVSATQAAPPFVDHRAPVAPAEVAARWLRDRVTTVGGDHTLRLVVKEAAIRETELPRTPGLRGVFTTDQSHRYDAVLDVDLEIRDPRGLRAATASARAERSRTVPETITLAGRETVWFELSEQLGRDINTELDRAIRDNLARFLAF